MAELPSHTLHAQQGFEFAEVFAYKFKGRALGTPPRQLALREPDGPSTAGGKRARQSMVLEADGGDALVCGWVDLSERTAEIRSFAYLNEQNRARRGEALGLPADAYEELMKEVAAFLRVNRLEVHRAERMPSAASPSSVRPGGGPVPLWLILALGILGGVALGFVLFG